MSSSEYSLSSDGVAVVYKDQYLMPITKDTPYDTLMILYSQHGVSRVAVLKKGEESLFYGWAPLPRAPKDLKDRHIFLGKGTC